MPSIKVHMQMVDKRLISSYGNVGAIFFSLLGLTECVCTYATPFFQGSTKLSKTVIVAESQRYLSLTATSAVNFNPFSMSCHASLR